MGVKPANGVFWVTVLENASPMQLIVTILLLLSLMVLGFLANRKDGSQDIERG